ncbi:P-loop containing nucleoside triphosphate hydrolase protein [Annulohypoxylon truncatum]|uniref:P-loop containing nucleoside triphosphate hydrolase protein n=1 Tax=Annulohypoxylon truncatum TaxID=327061 RepID=UPI0020087B7B|nr:P-loop containing nucleoside triphosphate hydrolase protein [Annulohypoxylon truncatum]KAI1208325.1 P-loop containing nucleoside triphosphate hydrolase protein [Annulohypoxylon truncatum]
MSEYRTRQLNKLFYNILEGKQTVVKLQDAEKFLESIVNRTDKADCIERLVTSESGQDALHKSLVLGNSAQFINAYTTNLLEFLRDPTLKRVGDGELLNQILWAMVDPPLFWNALVQHVKMQQLEAQSVESFAWLLLQLMVLPPSQSKAFRQTAESLFQDGSLEKSSPPGARAYFQQIRALIQHSQPEIPNHARDFNPGGRHDNDFVNYHDISILPTCAELQCAERPFYLQASAMLEWKNEDRSFNHLDNQFRLLREDMLAEIREDIKRTRSKSKKPSWKNMIIKDLRLESLDKEAMEKERPFTLVLQCKDDVLASHGTNIAKRKDALKRRPTLLKHQSFGCIMKNDNLLAFATLERNEDKLALLPPRLCLQIIGTDTLSGVLLALREGMVDFLLASTPIFAYEPILERLKRKTDIELSHDILIHSQDPMESAIQPVAVIDALEASLVTNDNLQNLLDTTRQVNLDPSQVKALIHGLTYQTCQIQGPPGTGKSLVGSLLAKILHDNTEETLLVLSYTNHALDQFIEDLLDIGINDSSIVRLGSKYTNRTRHLLLGRPTVDLARRTKTRRELIDSQKAKLDSLVESIDKSFDAYREDIISPLQLLEYLEFSEEESHFYDAFLVPEAAGGETRVGKKGRQMKPDYLFNCWANGKGPGPFAKEKLGSTCGSVWRMAKTERPAKIQQWIREIRQDHISNLVQQTADFNKTQKTLRSLQKENTEQVLRSKRIICCTTTAASMYAQEIQAASPGIIIVEEAGEILESHILAAMGPSTKQLIQIGDHKQLRPKVKNYSLTVEVGHGYDLNRSLFERLILQGRPHCTLLKQHRMRPEISALIRHNYPDLEDADSTKTRPHLRGFQDDIVFFNHDYPEVKYDVLADRLDQGASSSKQNIFEAEMILKCVRYLGQQDYKTTDLVILTPYLGQLSSLRDLLIKDHDPILNDLDSHDLVQAGIIPPESARVNKNPIRLSTIDNYQGEESDIVVVSLTRSNENGDIGFMCAPERLNVLISRARDALIMIGNANTFLNAKKGREEWTRLFDHLKANGKIHGGFPLKCEKHPETKHIVRSVEDFDLLCPDGGCALPCNEMLSCGKHLCTMRCHIRVDHTKVPCYHPMNDVCSQGHKLVWSCSDKNPPACQTCRREKEERDRKARRDKDLERERQAKQLAYAKQLRAIQDDIAAQRKIMQDVLEERRREQTIKQHKIELAQLKEQARKPLSNILNPKQEATQGAKKGARQGAKQESMQESKPAHQSVTKPNTDCDESRPSNSPSPDEAPSQGPTENAQESDPTDDDNVSETSHESDQPPTTENPSPAEADWQHQKDYENASNEALDSLCRMIGLESVKKEFLTIKARIDTSIRQGTDIKDERFGAALLGNPGTGKTTVARLYAKFLSSVGAIPGDHFEETTGSRLANDGVQGCKALIDEILNKGGGVFFLDEAYQIVSGSSFGGGQVLDFLLAEIENLRGKVVFVFAGYRKQMEAFFAHNPGIPSRIPIQMDFQDYEDGELLKILNYQLEKKFNGRMKVERGSRGLYMRILTRRIGRGRGKEGFGNAREVENVLSIVLGRQANRLHQERRKGSVPDDLLLKKIDIIGPPPNQTFSGNKDWLKLNSMIGLESVKQAVKALMNRLQTNYDRELKEQPLVECSLNKVFTGNPGTGKTTVAKLYGGILKALGLLSNGEVIIKNPSDFVGSVLGGSEKNTKAILDSTKGKVLIIDEAYMLASGGSKSGGTSDPYKEAVIDTIVAEVQSTALEDRCVLLLGYKEQMEDMFQKVNPGLTRRFPISSGFNFEDYDDGELRKILDLKLKQQGFKAGEATKKVVIEVLRRARNKPNFGNAGEVDIILDQAKERQQRRVSKLAGKRNVDILEPEDIDPEFDRSDRAATNVRMLFKDVIGCDDIIEQLEGYQQVVQNMKAMDMDPVTQIPFGFLFRGPPGTGKTTTAKKMGKVYYDMGFLAEATVVECSATDLIGQYVGQTGPKVQKKFDDALGRVLFVDEAYRLAEGHFAKEAMDEIVDCLTKEKYQNKLVVILAGYDNDINRLMNQNPGLTSRFPETVVFSSLPPRHCRDLLLQCLQKKKLNTKVLEDSPTLDSQLLNLFGTLAQTPSWGNARDVQTLARSVFSKIMKSKTPDPNRVVPESLVIEVIKAMIKERTDRAASALPYFTPPPELSVQQRQASQEPPPPPQVSTSIATDTVPPPEEEKEDEPAKKKDDGPEDEPKNLASIRDAGVSNAVWVQLQLDRLAAVRRQRELAETQRKAAELERAVREQEAALQRQKDEAKRREQLRLLEQARRRRDAEERKRREEEETMRKEKEVQAKLKVIGRCPVGFEWIKQAGGYRCAGGTHFVGDAALGL